MTNGRCNEKVQQRAMKSKRIDLSIFMEHKVVVNELIFLRNNVRLPAMKLQLIKSQHTI